MRAITANNIGNADLEVSRRILINRNNIAREGVIMNLISNIVIKDKDMMSSSSESKKLDVIRDSGYNLYRNLEFGKRESKHINRNIHLDMLCNKLI
ncbi:MAG: hypothetical protein K0R84_1492 [Clostridia bacterium]|jgi:hypothetical protein|nr:hypothetical protein [Clostridia bacterium]